MWAFSLYCHIEESNMNHIQCIFVHIFRLWVTCRGVATADCWNWGEWGPSWLVRLTCLSGTRDFCSALAVLVGLVKNIFFLHVHYFNSVCPHRPASWAGSRAGSPVFYYVSRVTWLSLWGKLPPNLIAKCYCTKIATKRYQIWSYTVYFCIFRLRVILLSLTRKLPI